MPKLVGQISPLEVCSFTTHQPNPSHLKAATQPIPHITCSTHAPFPLCERVIRKVSQLINWQGRHAVWTLSGHSGF